MTTASLRFGQVLFRLRSVTPVPVLVVCALLLWRSRGVAGPGGVEGDLVLDAIGLALALAGQVLRFYTLGWVPGGTSGQDLSLQASTLNTKGPYAHVRNPLYVGNLGITLGLLCIANDAWVYAIGLGFFFGEYFFIIRAEEDFLRQKFGPPFDAYCATVRRWVPRLTAAADGRLRDGGFDWKRALKKEINPFSAWAAGAVLLIGWERAARSELSSALQLGLAVTLGVVLVSLGIVKAWKKGWLFSS